MKCYGNEGYDYGAYCKNFEDREVFDPEVGLNLDTAWCKLHNCPCKNLGYTCPLYESDPEDYKKTDTELNNIAKSMREFNKAVENYYKSKNIVK